MQKSEKRKNNLKQREEWECSIVVWKINRYIKKKPWGHKKDLN